MSTIQTQLVINNISLPKDIIYIVKQFVFHEIRKICDEDERYAILQTIPPKIYYPIYKMTVVDLEIPTDDSFVSFTLFYRLMYQLGRLSVDRIYKIHNQEINMYL